MHFIPAGFEWVILIVVVAVVFFGVKKIPQLARSFGTASTEYQKARIIANKELQELKGQSSQTDRQKLEEVATLLGIDYMNLSDSELRSRIEGQVNNTKQET